MAEDTAFFFLFYPFERKKDTGDRLLDGSSWDWVQMFTSLVVWHANHASRPHGAAHKRWPRGRGAEAVRNFRRYGLILTSHGSAQEPAVYLLQLCFKQNPPLWLCCWTRVSQWWLTESILGECMCSPPTSNLMIIIMACIYIDSCKEAVNSGSSAGRERFSWRCSGLCRGHSCLICDEYQSGWIPRAV